MTMLQHGLVPSTGGYRIERSLRFNSADSAYLNRTPASAGNRKTWTWSGWVKICKDSTSDRYIFAGNSAATDAGFLGFGFTTASTTLFVSGWATNWRITTQVFRDFSAWYHIVVALDTTQATANDRIKIYINGTQVTAFSTTNNPTQNADLGVNTAAAHYLSSYNGTNAMFDGYLTEVNFIDGQALTPSSFGETDTDTGVWKPKAYSGSYGTNGFYLKFADNSGTTSTTLGKDSSGNGNNWTPNNFSVTAGAGNDSLVDTPTPYGTDTGAGGEVRGNYCTLNPLTKGAYLTLSNGNLQTAGNSATDSTDARSTFAFSTGKWYWEFTPTTINSIYPFNGIILSKDATSPNTGTTNQVGVATDSCAYLASGSKRVSNSTTSYGNSYTANDVIGVAVDADNGAIYFSKNGTWQNSGSPTSGSSKTGAAFTWTGGASEYVAAVSEYNTSASNINFGQRPFAYTAPSGFKALCTQNLPTPTIGATSATQAGKYFNTVLYTGNGSTQSITGVGFQPDWVWIKPRSAADNHILVDAVRGTGAYLFSDLTNAEVTGQTTRVTSFDSNGFSLGSSGSVNTNTTTYVAWNWNAGGSNVTNTAGTITSTVRANTTAGFSVVTYTGNGSASATVGHGLGVTPSMIICKSRSNTTAWYVKHTSLASNNNLLLAGTDAQYNVATGSGNGGLGNLSSSTTFGFLSGTSSADAVNLNGGTFVAYCFAAVAGYSAFGSYTGNGSTTDGPFVYTGFRPAYVLIKESSTTNSWVIVDKARSPDNDAKLTLFPNLSNAENDGAIRIDLVSNGFKVRNSNNNVNESNQTFIYAAFAEVPQKFSLAR